MIIETIYGVCLVMLPFFIGWVWSSLKDINTKLNACRSYQKTDHKIFMNEVSAAHKRLNQLEMIVFNRKNK